MQRGVAEAGAVAGSADVASRRSAISDQPWADRRGGGGGVVADLSRGGVGKGGGGGTEPKPAARHLGVASTLQTPGSTCLPTLLVRFAQCSAAWSPGPPRRIGGVRPMRCDAVRCAPN